MKKKKFAKIREWNRKRNYYFKQLKLDFTRYLYDRKIKSTVDLATIHKVLVLRHDDKIGDMVVSTILYRELKSKNFQIDVLAGKKNHCIIEKNPHINKVWIYEDNKEQQYLQAKKLANEKYDLVIEMGDIVTPEDIRLLSVLNPKHAIGFNKDKINFYSISIPYSRWEEHITTRYIQLLEKLDIKDVSTGYDIYIPEHIQHEVFSFWEKLSANFIVVLNPFAADEKRDLSAQQVEKIINTIKEVLPSSSIILIGEQKKLSACHYQDVIINPCKHLLAAAEIIRKADLVISPDTAIVHLAAAWKKPMICFYGNDMHGSFVNSDVWGPGYDLAVQLKSQDQHHTISTIPLEKIESVIKNTLKRLTQ